MMFVPSAALNAGAANSFTSISGSASARWRRKNSTPTASPAAIAAPKVSDQPSSAMRFMP